MRGGGGDGVGRNCPRKVVWEPSKHACEDLRFGNLT